MPVKILYFDDKHNIVSQEEATQFVRREEDERGNLLKEHWGFINKGNKEED